MHTYRSALALIGAGVPDHLVADAEVPILTGPQAQGDLLVIPQEEPIGPGRHRINRKREHSAETIRTVAD
jgi:hypothetical protein